MSRTRQNNHWIGLEIGQPGLPRLQASYTTWPGKAGSLGNDMCVRTYFKNEINQHAGLKCSAADALEMREIGGFIVYI